MIEDDYNDQGSSCSIQNEKIQLEAFETEEEAIRFATDDLYTASNKAQREIGFMSEEFVSISQDFETCLDGLEGYV